MLTWSSFCGVEKERCVVFPSGILWSYSLIRTASLWPPNIAFYVHIVCCCLKDCELWQMLFFMFFCTINRKVCRQVAMCFSHLLEVGCWTLTLRKHLKERRHTGTLGAQKESKDFGCKKSGSALISPTGGGELILGTPCWLLWVKGD